MSIDLIKDYLSYDECSGLFRFSLDYHKFKAGDVVGTITKKGYVSIKILGLRFLSHRLAWFYVNGKWPSGDIDHIDGNPLNNSINNLRDVSRLLNLQNQKKAHKNNISGFLGVEKNGDRWRARIRVNKVRIDLGTFDTPEEAHKAYMNAKKTLHEGFVDI